MARRSLFSVISSAAAILILAAGCSDAMPTGAVVDQEELVAVSELGKLAPPNIVLAARGHRGGVSQELISPDGGTIEFEGGSINFPAGAVAQDTKINARVDANFLAVTFGPHGLQFPADAQPTLTISFAGTEAGSDLTVLYLGNDGAVIESLGGTVNVENQTVTLSLEHFSTYALATN